MFKVGIIGASGYTGVELLRLCAQHPMFNVVYATGDSQAGTLASSLYPSLAVEYPNLVFDEFSIDRAAKCDIVFLGLPHEVSMEIVPQLHGVVRLVVDLSGAFRLLDPASYPKWYGFDHTCPELLSQAVYGLPELYRKQLIGANLIATPGCYVTAASLALAPLVSAGVIDTQGVIVDAASGVSGAGRALKDNTMFATANEDFSAYGVLVHRHTPEIEQVTGAQVLFTPHLAPMNRGILATCYARPATNSDLSTSSLLATLARAYKGEPFVVVRPALPSTKATLGTNSAHLTARFDDRTGYVMVLCAIDNLTKGASGGAIQAANVALGIDETLGLTSVGLYP
ncbi:MAG: N-acetyl-gamma-glutamyl-phosphate reductase [Ilumatobacteraceae bacterium]